jgi:hypothetical protein
MTTLTCSAIALVAMNGTLGAGRLFSAESATIQSQPGVIHQALALVTELFPMMIAAIDLDHRFNGFEFACEARVGFVRGRGGFCTDLVQHLSSGIHLTCTF